MSSQNRYVPKQVCPALDRAATRCGNVREPEARGVFSRSLRHCRNVKTISLDARCGVEEVTDTLFDSFVESLRETARLLDNFGSMSLYLGC
jgi:hypothetical protein